MLGRKIPKAQSAMEYLMTYGWAILIIAVVLGALFSLGVFSGGSLVGTACVASPGYLCSSPVLASNGQLSFTFGQNTGSSITDIEFSCSATSASTGLPSNSASWYLVNSIGVAFLNVGPSTAAASFTGNAFTFVTGQTLAISALPCYGTTGVPLGSAYGIGTAYSGYVWMNYTTTSSPSLSGPGPSNPWYTVKMATLSLKEV